MVKRFDAVESGRTNLREYFLTKEVARTIQTKQQKAEEIVAEGPTKRPSKLARFVAAYPGEILVWPPEMPPLMPPKQAQTPVASSTDPWMPAGRGGSGASGPQLIMIPPFSPPGSKPGTAGVQMVPGAPSYPPQEEGPMEVDKEVDVIVYSSTEAKNIVNEAAIMVSLMVRTCHL
jgi:hypothetical protein